MRSPARHPVSAVNALLGASLLVLLASTQGHAQGQSPPAADAAADPFLSAEGAASQAARDADPKVDEIETIRAEIAELHAEVTAIDVGAKGATGDDLLASRTKALDLRLRAMEKLGEFAGALAELEPSSSDAARYRDQLEQLLPRLASGLATQIDAAESSVAALEKERDAASPEERPALEQRIARRRALVGRLFAAGVEVVEMAEEFDLPAATARKEATDRLSTGARVTSSRIELLNEELSDAEERQSRSPDDAALAAEVAALRGRLDSNTSLLAVELGLMDRLGMKTAEYKKLLIRSTGEITTDVFDAEVAQGLAAEWLDSLRQSVVRNGPGAVFKAVVFLLLLGAFWVLSRFVRRITERAVRAPNLRFSQLLQRMIVSLASGVVLLMGLLVGLSQLGFEVGPLLAGLGIAGFIVGFALQDTLGNFAAGVMILAYRPFDVGDLIECAGGVYGKVSHMNLVSTTVLTLDNQTEVVPNAKIWGEVITNVTAQRHRRVDLVFGISYTDDIPHAEEVMWSVLKEHPKVLADPEPVVKLHELGDSSVNFVVRPWCTPDDYWDVHWDITREIKLRFDREGVSIPFPQRDVHFYPQQANGAAPLQLRDATPQPHAGPTPHTGRGEADAGA